jgi:hypothetical protein
MMLVARLPFAVAALGLLLAVAMIGGLRPLASASAAGDGAGGRGGAIPHTGAIVRQDLARSANFMSQWHFLNPSKPSRVDYRAARGDPHPLIDGSRNRSWRRISARKGDQAAHDSGRQRVQLGASRGGESGTLKTFRKGQRFITYWSMRIHSVNIPADTGSQVWQMQEEAGGSPVITFGWRRHNELRLTVKSGSRRIDLWRARVPTHTWLRFAVDVKYSNARSRSRIQLWGDPDGGGRALKRLTPAITRYATLAPSGRRSYLVAGIYGDASLPAHHIDFANWQVAKWAR